MAKCCFKCWFESSSRRI